MNRRYVKWAIIGVTVAIVGSFGLYWSWSGASDAEGGLGKGQGILSSDEKPTITSPGGGIDGPEKKDDNRQPGGETP